MIHVLHNAALPNAQEESSAAFTLADPSRLHVYIDGVSIPASDYTTTATGIVFDVAPASGTTVVLHRITPIEQPFTTPGLRIYSLSKIAEAFRTLQEASHGGAGSIAAAPTNKPLRFTGTLTRDSGDAE